ncbi:MAG: DNA polymerase I [Gammaproteobacteria bacterium]|nr:DNA polymerase I [Gammaproteobacteria bacterium]MBU1733001.1 DNA polymerase I [Gammaproteobacteria bacterium]MBU1892049.1 DNA polymerase I [Gammaproteobacteria bacterium]
MKTLLLVDASSYLYRAFHALPDLRNRHNEPTGAIYGVLNMLRRLHQDYQADYSACVFDAKGKTFRDELYPDYKAHRPPMPPDLAAQIEPLHDSIRAMGWPLLAVEGVEADDVIGTLAQIGAQAGMRVVISTGDKDIAQLVNGHVSLINTMSNEALDEAGVTEKFGVPPERIVDYLTLIGDSADNVPGVEKVGPKTAVKWLSQYQTLDNLVVHANEVSGVVGDNLRKALDWLPKARELLTIRCNVPLPLKLENLTAAPPDALKLAQLYERLEFKTWLRELQNSGSSEANPAIEKPAVEARYECILSEEQLEQWMVRLEQADLVSVDTETTSLDPMRARLVGISFAVSPHEAAYLPLTHHYAGVPPQLDFEHTLQRLKPWLENPSRAKLGQNLKYDTHVFANHGIALQGIEHDTLLQSYVVESHKPHDMDSLASRHLGVKTLTYAEVAGKGAKQIGFDEVDLETATRYAAEDADITLQLHHALYPQISPDARLEYVYREIEVPVSQILFHVERNGVLIDSNLLAKQSRLLGEKLLTLEQGAHQLAGQPFNLNSPKQIQEILFGQLGLPVKKKTPGGTPSTDEDVLLQLAEDYPLPKLLLEYRGLAKLKSTYTDKLPRMVDPATGRVHTSYNQAVAVTGRLSSTDPNLQNIPVRSEEGRRIREAFIAPAGSSIISADYSQIELRIMAHLSGDKSLLRAFAAGEDIHRATAAEIFTCTPLEVTPEQRRYAKVINFGLIYGMSAFGLASQLGIERSAAQAYMDRYFARYPGVADYMARTREMAKQQGYVETVFGRRLWLPDIKGGNGPRRQAAERAAINAPMQGTAADLIKLAMIAVHRWLQENRMKTLLVMQVHDELVLEVPQDELAAVRRVLPGLMCNVATLAVPLLAEMGEGANWEQAH